MQFSASARIVLSFSLAVSFAWVFLSFWRRERDQPALAFWGAAQCTWAAAMLAFGLRGVIPDWTSINLGNTGVVLGYGLIWGGARRLGGHRAPLAGIVAGAVAWSLLALLPNFLTILPARVLVTSVIVLAYDLATAACFLDGRRRARLPSHGAVIGVLMAHAGVFLLRAVFAVTVPMETVGLATPEGTWVTLLTILSLALTATLAILLVALSRERHEVDSNAILAAARNRADAANVEKSRFLAWMSHELRTPINGVLGMAQALAHDPTLSPAQHDRAATLERAGEHLLGIVNDTLDLARVEAGRIDLAPRPLRLRPWLEEALDLMQASAAAKDIALRLEVAPAVPDEVLGDPLRLRQILLNLLGNAVKFTPAGGTVTLGVSLAATMRTLDLAVTDTGPGVPPELRTRLFGEFMQGSREVQAGEGTGLGLAISDALARAMGGSLAYAPGPAGQGSVFTATLPLPGIAPVPAQHAPPALAAPPSLADSPTLAASPARPTPAEALPGIPAPPLPGLLLLVVDDVLTNRKVARALLELAGHVVVEAADGPAAVAALREGPLPDAVLMDVRMPGMDGYQATALIRALDGPAARVPIIALTAEAMPEAVAASYAAGLDGHLLKPISRAALAAELERVVGTR